MNPERWQKIKELFRSALERDASQRVVFLDEACAGDLELRQEIESLLACDEQAGNFMQASAVEGAGALITDDRTRSMIGRRIGPYKVQREIGHGGMGAVYLATRADDEYRKQVAIKLVKRGMDTDAILRRFRNERQILANLDHSNIAKLLDGGTTEDGLSYFVMDYVEGLPIDVYCDTHKLATLERLKLFRSACSAVHYAHQHQVVHRDLKPSNILVTAEGVPKLLDFGIAKVLDPEVSARTLEPTAGLRPMTPDYASPEQVRGEAITPVSDVYSLGVMLYELLTGHRPYHFQSGTPQEAERVICEQEPEKPSTAVGRCSAGLQPGSAALKGGATDGVPGSVTDTRGESPEKLRRQLRGDLDNIVLMAMRKEPDRRYASVEEFSEDIGRHLEGLPVRARKDTLAYRSAKYIKRNKAGVMAAALMAMVVIALISVGLYLLGRHDKTINKGISSIAVLPLENLSGDPAQEYFADGMTEALITDLAQIGALRVISRTSVMQYKKGSKPVPQIGRELKVDAVVEGSVLRAGDRVRITAQLIQATTDRHLWAKTYERDMRDVLALQGEVASSIAQEIKIKLSPQEHLRVASSRPVDREAYEAYLKGHYQQNKGTDEGNKKAVEYFQRAIEKDPSYAQAYAGLADASGMLSFHGGVRPKECLPRAKAAAMKALELDDSLAEGHTALGLVLFRYEWDRSGAEKEFKRAIELNPNYAPAYTRYAMHLADLGRMDEAVAVAKRVQDLDPLSLNVDPGLPFFLYLARQYDQAIEEGRKQIEWDPNFAPGHIGLGLNYLQKGRYEESIAEFQKAATLGAGPTVYVVAELGYAYALLGQRGEAQKRIDELKELSKRRYVPPNSIALIYTGLGEKDRAFEWLEKAYEARDDGAGYNLKACPLWDPIRSDPRFTDLLRRFRFPR